MAALIQTAFLPAGEDQSCCAGQKLEAVYTQDKWQITAWGLYNNNNNNNNSTMHICILDGFLLFSIQDDFRDNNELVLWCERDWYRYTKRESPSINCSMAHAISRVRWQFFIIILINTNRLSDFMIWVYKKSLIILHQSLICTMLSFRW